MDGSGLKYLATPMLRLVWTTFYLLDKKKHIFSLRSEVFIYRIIFAPLSNNCARKSTTSTNFQLEFTAKNDHVRVRQLVVFGGVEEVAPTSTLPSCQQFALQVFRFDKISLVSAIQDSGC